MRNQFSFVYHKQLLEHTYLTCVDMRKLSDVMQKEMLIKGFTDSRKMGNPLMCM